MSNDDIFYVDLTSVDPDMKSNWWHRVCTKNFGFMERIPLLKHCKLMENDVLIHKELKETDKFPVVRYFYVIDKEPLLMSNEDIKRQLADKLVEFVLAHQKLPFACSVVKGFKNGNVQIDYTPQKWVNFALKMTPKRMLRYNIEDDDIFAYFSQFSTINQNPLEFTKNIQTIR